jgi:hypothetical protein
MIDAALIPLLSEGIGSNVIHLSILGSYILVTLTLVIGETP